MPLSFPAAYACVACDRTVACPTGMNERPCRATARGYHRGVGGRDGWWGRDEHDAGSGTGARSR